MIRTLILSSLAASTVLLGTARAGMLFQRTVIVDHDPNIFTSLDFDLDVVVSDDFFAPTSSFSLFDGLSIGPADVGATYVADHSDAAFLDVVDKLSDGQDEIITIYFSELSTGRIEERGFHERGFFLASNPILPPDLAGNVIESISLTIDEFTLDFGSNAGGATATPPVELALTIAFNGAPVPEPAAWAMAVTVVGLLFASPRAPRRLVAGVSTPLACRRRKN